jgi:hypothetical protein
MILVGSSSEERGTNVIGCVDFLNELPGSSEELFVDLIFNGKSRVRVPSEMLISNQLDFQGQEILLRCYSIKDFDAIVNENYDINYPRIS